MYGYPRIIPARAGFTQGHRPRPARPRDHPRSRGVYSKRCTHRRGSRGSSPLARGLLAVAALADAVRGIIPARAGFTDALARASVGSRDHPRSRGVYCPSLRCAPSRPGSSPLARGLPITPPSFPTRQWIIPARAGFTSGAPPRTLSAADHPRSRGVYDSDNRPGCRPRGSSPLARGLPSELNGFVQVVRIIPARAGFTVCGPRGRGSGRDHPRSRGVYDGLAHDGEPAQDHPRSRGVYDLRGRPGQRRPGSSPLARGLLVVVLGNRVVGRIIPARAGFT